MSAEIEQLIAKLREEVDKKCRAQHKALDDLAADLLGQRTSPPNGERTRAILLPSAPLPQPGQQSTVQRVLGAIAHEYKTVSAIAEELGLPENKVRAALYSKFVRRRRSNRLVDGVAQFKAKPDEVARKLSSGNVRNLAGEVRTLLGATPQGLTAGQVVSALKAGNAKEKKAIGAALYNMKQSGKVLQDESGVYRMIAQTVNSNGQG